MILRKSRMVTPFSISVLRSDSVSRVLTRGTRVAMSGCFGFLRAFAGRGFVSSVEASARVRAPAQTSRRDSKSASPGPVLESCASSTVGLRRRAYRGGLASRGCRGRLCRCALPSNCAAFASAARQRRSCPNHAALFDTNAQSIPSLTSCSTASWPRHASRSARLHAGLQSRRANVPVYSAAPTTSI